MNEQEAKEIEKINKENLNDMIAYENAIHEKNVELIEQVEQLTSKKYRDDVVFCLEETETYGFFSLVNITTIKTKYYQEEDYESFDHIYVNQTTDGGYTGDEFAGIIWIPITKKLYLKASYSM